MNGYTITGEGFDLREIASAQLLDEEVRVQVEFCCLEPRDLQAPQEWCPGGGLVGTVIECGSAATAFDGARVLVPSVVACGECDTCRSGAATVCPTRSVLGRDRHGGCAESVVCSGRWLTRADDLLPLSGPTAALAAGPALRAYAMYCRAGVRAGDVVLVFGHGPAASVLATLATQRGSKVARTDVDESAEAVSAQLQALGCADRPQKIFVCDGEANVAKALSMAHPSSIITLGIGTGSIDASVVFAKELALLHLGDAHPDLLPEAAALVVKGELDLGSILSERTLGASTPVDAAEAEAEGRCLVVPGL